MAPSPAAGKSASAAPKTPTKLGRKPQSTPQKLGQASQTPTSSKAPSTPKTASAKKPDTNSISEKAPEAPKVDEAKSKAEEAASKVELKDDDEDEEPMSKVSEAGQKGEEELGEAAPEPVADDEVDDAVGGATENAEEATEEASEEADVDDDDDVADDATEKAGQIGESADEGAEETADDAEEVTEKGKGKASGLAGNAPKDAQKSAGDAKDKTSKTAGDAKEQTEETNEDAESTADDAADEGQKVAGETTDEAGEAAEGVEGDAEDATDEVEDGAEDAAETAEDGAEDATEGVDGEEVAEGVMSKTGEAAESAKDEAEDVAEDAPEDAEEGAEGAVNGVKEGAEDVAETAEQDVDDTKEGAEDAAGDAEGEASETVDNIEDATPKELPLDLTKLKGLEVKADGTVEDAEGNQVAKLAEGDAEDLEGYPIGDNGEILDDDGDLVGRVELLPEEIKRQLQEKREAGEELPAEADEYIGAEEGEDGEEDEDDEEGEDEEEEDTGLPPVSILEGLTCQVDGLIYDSEGNTVGKVIDGDPEELQNATLNDQGEFIDEEGNVVGHADLHEEAADLVEQGVYDSAKAVPAADDEEADEEDGEAEEVAEGALEDGEEAVEDAEGEAEGIEDELPGIEDELPGIEALEGKELNEAGEVVDEKGDILAQIDDEELKQKIVDGEIDPANLAINEEGQVVDEEGNVLGGMELAEGAAEKLSKLAPTYDIRILEGRKVNKKGKVIDDDGEEIGQLTEGDPAKCTGQKINEKGEVVDKKGNVIGKVGITEGEAAETATKDLLTELGEIEPEEETPEEEEESTLPGLDTLEGLKVNKKGQVLNEDGETIGELEEGDITACAGRKINDKGEVLDKNGNVIGKVKTLPAPGEDDEEEEETPEEEQAAPGLDVLEGLKINKKGQVLNEEGETIGELTEGEITQCAGRKINNKGEILDDEGNVIGKVSTIAAPGDEEEEDQTPGLDVLDGLKLNKNGQVLDENGDPIGELTDGEITQCAGRKVNNKGEILDNEGNVIGKVSTISPPGEEEEEGESGSQLPPLSVLEGLSCNKAGKLIDSKGVIVGELVEGDAKKLAKSGITADNEGQFWDNKGHVIGRAQTVPVEDAEEESPFAGLEGLKVIEDGWVADENGNVVGQVTEGDPKKLVGRSVDEDGDIIDKKGSVVGHAERYEPEEEQEAEAADLSFLQGKVLNKAGNIIGDEGVPVARLVEGSAKDLAGKKVDDQGQIWNDAGKVIGRVELIPDDERERPEGEFAGLEGLRVIEGGKVADEDENIVGEVVEGNAKRLIGMKVDEDGDILDKHGNTKGHAERLPEEEEAPPVDNSILEGKTLNKKGYVVDEDGKAFGILIEGNAKELAGRKCDENGYVYGDTGKVAGRCEILPEDQRTYREEGPFEGLEGLRVVKGGKVEDADGNVRGEIVEGNPKRLVGMAVDEDGDILDKNGNVKGHAEPFDEEDPEAPDLSMLAGTEINKAGYAVDGNGKILGRLVEGDPSTMIGKKVDGEGQVWDNAGNVVGRCEVVHGQDTKEEGPFAGFENLEINKDGTITTQAGDIIGRVIEGDIKKLLGHRPDDDGDITDKNGNVIGKAERWEPKEKDRRVNPMSGMRVNKEGEVRDENGDLIGRLTDGSLGHCVGQEIDDNGNVVDQDGNKIGECTLLENIDEETYEGPSEEELEEARKREEEREVAEKMNGICVQTIDRMQPICKQIREHMERADRTPKDELDEEELVNQVKPLIEEGGRVLQECNGSLRGLDPDGHIAAQAKGRSGTKEATPEEYKLAENLKELTTTVVTTIDDAKKKLNDMPHAKKKLNPLWGLLTQPLFQILAAVGLLLAGVLGLVGQLLNGLGLGGLVNGLLGGLGVNKLLSAVGLKDDDGKKKGGKGKSALSSLPVVGGMLGGGK